MEATEERIRYEVVVNSEEQYSIWPKHLDIPVGWRRAGFDGTKESCLEYVREHWTDLRPLSLRRRLKSSETRGSNSALTREEVSS